MATYTIQLKDYIEGFSTGATKTSDIIEAGRKKLFDFDYPIFDTKYKAVFETHFIRNFYMREIGFETEGLFKFQLETWLLINMPFFNKYFESELLKFDPLSNANVKDSTNRTGSGTSKTNSNTNANSSSSDDRFGRELSSDNPDTRLTITSQDGQGVIEYANKIDEHTENNSTQSNGNTSSTQTGSATSTENYLATRSGKTGDVSYSKLLNEYRDTFLNIEKRIFNEMNDLFMLVY